MYSKLRNAPPVRTDRSTEWDRALRMPAAFTFPPGENTRHRDREGYYLMAGLFLLPPRNVLHRTKNYYSAIAGHSAVTEVA
jgi:hypothetical protein